MTLGTTLFATTLAKSCDIVKIKYKSGSSLISREDKSKKVTRVYDVGDLNLI